MHWDGTAWTLYDGYANTNVFGLTTLTDGDAWAAGGFQSQPPLIRALERPLSTAHDDPAPPR